MSLRCKSDNVSEGESSGGGKMPRPGRYHFSVESYELKDGDKGRKLSIKAVVLAGKPKNPADGDQTGRTMTNYFNPDSTSEGAQNALRLFTIATDLATDQQWQDAKARGEEVDIPIEEVVGRQYCADIDERPGTGASADKKFPDAGWSFMHPLSKKAEGIPKDPEWIALLGGAPASNGNGHSQENKPTPTHKTTQQSTQPVATGGSVWDSFK
jgi:hypothetical protein